jgi:E1-E2 ATPase/cation transport ATPase-like protein
MINRPLDRFWSLPVQGLFDRLSTRPEGLSRVEADDRLARYGPNTVAEPPRLDIIRKIGRRFAEPLVSILLVAAAISGATGDLGSFAIIVTVIVLSIGLDLFQEHRAERAAEALKRSVAVHADVRRDGIGTATSVDQLVPGDVVELRAGDLVPADGIVLESRNAHANEALMTGEPYPADKYPGPCNATTPPEAFNALFAGTFNRQRGSDHARGGDRQGDPLRWDCGGTHLARTAERIRARHPSPGSYYPQAYDLSHLVRAADELGLCQASARVFPFRGRSRGGTHARTVTHDHDGHACAGRVAHGPKARGGEEACGYS